MRKSKIQTAKVLSKRTGSTSQRAHLDILWVQLQALRQVRQGVGEVRVRASRRALTDQWTLSAEIFRDATPAIPLLEAGGEGGQGEGAQVSPYKVLLKATYLKPMWASPT